MMWKELCMHGEYKMGEEGEEEIMTFFTILL